MSSKAERFSDMDAQLKRPQQMEPADDFAKSILADFSARGRGVAGETTPSQSESPRVVPEVQAPEEPEQALKHRNALKSRNPKTTIPRNRGAVISQAPTGPGTRHNPRKLVRAGMEGRETRVTTVHFDDGQLDQINVARVASRLSLSEFVYQACQQKLQNGDDALLLDEALLGRIQRAAARMKITTSDFVATACARMLDQP